MTYAAVSQAIEHASFTVLGAFAPEGGDRVPVECGTLILVGNAGPKMWERFVAERSTTETTMDSWTEAALTTLADELGSTVFFPFAKPPLPFLSWAQRAQAGFVSPLGAVAMGNLVGLAEFFA